MPPDVSPDPLAGASPKRLVRLLAGRGETVATAESLTAGLVSATIAGVPGASAVLRGGLIVYATELKQGLADVDAELLARRGPVDPDVARAMAAGAAARCSATWGIGLTGVAGPDPQDGHPPGTVYLGLAGPGGTTSRALDLGGDRWQIRFDACTAAIDGLCDWIEGN